MATLKRPEPAKEIALAKALGIDPIYVKGGSIKAEHTGNDQHVWVTWECVKAVPLEEFNDALTQYYA